VATLVAAQIGPRYRVYGNGGSFVKFGVDPQEEMLKAGRRPGDPGFGEDAREQWGTLGDGTSVVSVPSRLGEYTRFYAGVAEALRSGTPVPVDARDAVTGIVIVEAAHQSASTNRVVELQLDSDV